MEVHGKWQFCREQSETSSPERRSVAQVFGACDLLLQCSENFSLAVGLEVWDLAVRGIVVCRLRVIVFTLLLPASLGFGISGSRMDPAWKGSEWLCFTPIIEG